MPREKFSTGNIYQMKIIRIPILREISLVLIFKILFLYILFKLCFAQHSVINTADIKHHIYVLEKSDPP